MRFTLKDLNKKYSVNIVKIASKYFLENKEFKNLSEANEFLELTEKNKLNTDIDKQNKYDRFKFILLNNKPLKSYAIAFLNQIYGLIDFTRIKKHHNCLSITIEENIELITPNQYANRNKTMMQNYQNKTRLGDKGNALESITRIEQKVINLDRVLSIYVYTAKTDQHNRIIDKYDIVNLYRKELKQKSKILTPIKHKEIVSKYNDLIYFNKDKSTIYRFKNVDYQIWIDKDQLFLTINNEKIPQSIATFKILSKLSYEYNYHKSGTIVNDKNKNLTMGKVKTLLNNSSYDELYSYLINPYLLGYEKTLNDNGKIEKLELIFNYGVCYFEKKPIQDTFINCYPQKSDLMFYVNTYIANLKSLENNYTTKIIDTEDKLYSDQPEKIKIKLRQDIEFYENKIDQVNKEKLKIESITISDLDHVIKKFLKSITNKDNVQSLNKSNGTEYQQTLKITHVNKRLDIKNSNTGNFNKISVKKVEKLALRFISLLDQNNLVIGDRTYRFNYFRVNINRDDFKNPYKEKITIRKNQLDPKILIDFNQFMMLLIMGNFDPHTQKPLIYPSSVPTIDKWLEKNNSYLSQYGIEIIELTDEN